MVNLHRDQQFSENLALTQMFGFNYPGIVRSAHIYINIFLINMFSYKYVSL